jgi:tyrosine-protein kinase Etk/Wzc
MNTTSAAGSRKPEQLEGFLDLLLYYWRIVSKRRTLVLGLCLGSTVLTLIYSLLQPRIYESTASIVVPREAMGGGLAAGLMASGVSGMLSGLSVPSITPHRDLFLSLLKSRTMVEEAVGHFDLQARYRMLHLADVVRRVQAFTEVSVSREGVISVKVQETDPQLAAEIANFFFSNLDRMVSRFRTSEASRQRAFIAQRLLDTEKDLRRAEDDLCLFQERHKFFALEEQTIGAVRGAVELEAHIVASEVQLEVLRGYANEENPQVIELKRRIQEMRRQLARKRGARLSADWSANLEESDDVSSQEGESYMSFAEFPDLTLELSRLKREVLVKTKIYSLLTEQLEEAKIAEARDLPVVQLLDRAIPALRKSRPRTTYNTLIAFCATVSLSVLLAVFLEQMKNLTVPKAKDKGRVRRPRSTTPRAGKQAPAPAQASGSGKGSPPPAYVEAPTTR